MVVGSGQTRLMVLRGNSGSGKSTVAKAVREACGGRAVALVSQDLTRRIVLREPDRRGGVNIGLIDTVTRYSLDHGYHVVLDGIFNADRYEPMLAGLGHDHAGLSCFYYLDASLEETLRRHATRPEAAEFGPDDVCAWYRPRDLLTSVREHVVPQASTLPETISRILTDTQLLQAGAVGVAQMPTAQPALRTVPSALARPTPSGLSSSSDTAPVARRTARHFR